MVADHHEISEETVWEGCDKDPVHDRSHTPSRLQTELTPAQEAVAVALRGALLPPRGDQVDVGRKLLSPLVPAVRPRPLSAASSLGNLQALKPREPKPTHVNFKGYEHGYLRSDMYCLPQMAYEDNRRYLLVAIDRAIGWFIVRINPPQNTVNARRFLRDYWRAAPR